MWLINCCLVIERSQKIMVSWQDTSSDNILCCSYCFSIRLISRQNQKRFVTCNACHIRLLSVITVAWPPVVITICKVRLISFTCWTSKPHFSLARSTSSALWGSGCHQSPWKSKLTADYVGIREIPVVITTHWSPGSIVKHLDSALTAMRFNTVITNQTGCRTNKIFWEF